MRGLLLTAMLACLHWLHAADENIPVQPDLDVRKLAGKWYPIAVVKSSPQRRVVYAYTIDPLSNGDMALKIDIPREGVCRRRRVVLHTVRPGIFETSSGEHTVHFVKTDYDTYHLTHFTMEDDERILFLYAREPEVSEELKEEMLQLFEYMGFDPLWTVYIPRSDLCPETEPE